MSEVASGSRGAGVALTLDCLGEGVVLGAAAGGLALAGDALFNAPTSVLLALVLGGSLGGLLGGLLGAARRVTAILPGWWALAAWTLGGVGLGLISAVGIGALDNLRGQQRLLALVTLTAAGLGGASLGATLALSQSQALRVKLAGRSRLVCRLSGAVSLIGAVGVVAAPSFARWLLVYPLAMKVSVAAVFVLAYAGISSWLELRFLPRRRVALGVLAGAVVAVVALALAPRSAFASFAGTLQGVQVLMALRGASDMDGDGSSGLFGGGDCAPANARIHPRANEVPGNGVDENCLLGDARPRASAPALDLPAPAGPAPVSVVLITIDALRADHTTPYGYSKPTTPELGKFARDARRYTRAFTAGGRTGLGLVTLLGGVQARQQRWQLVPRVVPGRGPNRSPWDVVPRSWAFEPIPTNLARRGMRTAAVLHFGAASWFAAGHTFDALFEKFVVAPDREALSDAQTVDAALEIVKDMGTAPYFLWVHLYGPHEPMLPASPDAPSFGNDIVGKYDADVWQSDREVGRLLSGIDAQPGPARVIAITADHSEEFAGDRTFHAVDMFGETPRIPLLVRGPGIPPGVDDRVVSAVDLAPSIMAWTQTLSPYPGFALSEPPRRRIALCDAFRPVRQGGFSLEHVVATDGRSRFTLDLWSGREASGPLQSESKESVDPASSASLRQAVLEYVEAYGAPDITVSAP